MERSEMARLAAEARARQASERIESDRIAAERERQLLEQIQEEQRQRIETLKRTIESWLSAMEAHDPPFPGHIPISLYSEVRTVGLFSSKTRRVEGEDSIGWVLAETSYGSAMFSDDPPSAPIPDLYLLADGRLMKAGPGLPPTAHELGSDFRIIKGHSTTRADKSEKWYRIEESIPDALRKIAISNGVDWSFDEQESEAGPAGA